MNRVTQYKLPRWFNLDMYHNTSKLTLAAWYDNLSWRFDLLSISDEQLTAMRDDINARFSGSDSMAFDWGPYAKGEISIRDECRIDNLKTQTIDSLRVRYVANSVADAFLRYGILGPQLADLAEKINEADIHPLQEDEILGDENRRLLDQPIDTMRREELKSFSSSKEDPRPDTIMASLGASISDDILHVEVDLSAPDQIIVKDFRAWLKTARRTYSIESKNSFTESMRQDWSDYGVLPYLDLSFWARANNLPLTDAVMGNALFPDSDVVSNVERVRKVVRPKAKWLMNPSVLQEIEAQVLRPK